MPVTIADLLVLGDTLAETDDESFRRAAIGRHYYALFHHCRAWHAGLQHPGEVRRANIGTHLQLVEQLSYPNAGISAELQRLSKKLGNKLDTARQRRARADYELVARVSKEDQATHSGMVKRAIVESPIEAASSSTPVAPATTVAAHAAAGTPLEPRPGIRRIK